MRLETPYTAQSPVELYEGNLDPPSLGGYLDSEFRALERSLDNGVPLGGKWSGLALGAAQITGTVSYDFANIGWLFPQNDTVSRVYLQGFLPWDEDNDGEGQLTVRAAILFLQASETAPTFEASVSFPLGGEAIPTPTVVTASTATYAYVSGTVLQSMEFDPIVIDDSAKARPFELALWRNDNDVTGTVLVKHFDIFVESNPLGDPVV
jgi:hypothetical protein